MSKEQVKKTEKAEWNEEDTTYSVGQRVIRDGHVLECIGGGRSR